MVLTSPCSDSAYVEWRELLTACENYARLTGWRFVGDDFMRLDQRHENDDLRAAREAAMPTALEYADRVRACADAAATGAEPPRLLADFQAAQRLVASEAVYNSMVATIAAVGLGSETSSEASSSSDDDDSPDRFAYHDMTQPVEIIAKRLQAYHANVEASPALAHERRSRLLHASFIVEFGLEHGLPDFRDHTSESMLKEFLERLGEWEGGKDDAAVRALVLESIPAGPAQQSLRHAAADWFDDHKGALIGGAILGGAIGVLVAGAAVAIAGAAAKGRGR